MWRRYAKSRAIASDLIQQDLAKIGYSKGLISEHGFKFTAAELHDYQVHGTTVDFMYPRFDFIIFLDGQPHLKDRQQTRDFGVTQVLKERGYTVKRYSYSAPISLKQRKEIVTAIKKVLDAKGYRAWRQNVFGS